MSANFSDRGLRELEYSMIPTGSALQRDIQLAGHVSECLELESKIKAMPKPNEATPRNEAYNKLAKQLNRRAENPNAAGAAAWEKTKKEVLSYFDSRLPIYADPSAPLTEKGYVLDTRKRTLFYFDGKDTHELCDFLPKSRSKQDIAAANRDWSEFETMFPSLFGFTLGSIFSNYTTLQPEKYINMVSLVRKHNPNAQFDKFVESEFLPLYANLAQHAATRALLVKHVDTRSLEQLTTDIVTAMLTTMSGYLTKLGAEGKADTISEEKQELLINIIEYLNTGDYSRLAGSVAKHESAWLTGTINWLLNNEVDKTLSIIKEMRQSAFLDKALQAMVARQYGQDRKEIILDSYLQRILGRKYETDHDEAELQDKITELYGTGATLQGLLQERIAKKLQIKDTSALNEEAWNNVLSGKIEGIGTIDFNALDAETKDYMSEVFGVHDASHLSDPKIKASVYASIVLRMQKEIFNQIADEITGTKTSRAALKEVEISDVHQYKSHIADISTAAEDANQIWQNCRVTKDAIKVSLTAMLEKLEALQEGAAADEVELPEIPLPQDLIPENEEQRNKTIIEHIKDCILRVQTKADNDPSKKSQYQADCAFLQSSIEQILNFRYAGGEDEEVPYMVTEEQRAVYNEVGEELTEILNNTQKQPLKEAEVLKSVESVRAEIHRLITFHNTVREKLTDYQTKLKTLDQGSFFNDIKKFTQKGGALDKKQKELDTLYDSLTNFPDDPFNVLAPATTWQKKVVEVVNELTAYGTELVDELEDVLLYQPREKGEIADTDSLPPERKYKSVISKAERNKNPEAARAKDSTQAEKFDKLMHGDDGITGFAKSLNAEETSRLATFFEEAIKAPGRFGSFSSTSSSTRSPSLGSDEDLTTRGGFGMGRKQSDK